MSLLSWIGISTAYAVTNAPATQSTHTAAEGFLSMIMPILIIMAVVYFLFIRPQAQRAKQQRTLIDSLNIGDEVVTIGGIVGRVTKLRDNYIVLNTGQNGEMLIQKNAVGGVLPKGTMDNLN